MTTEQTHAALLPSINSPADLKQLSEDQLPQLAQEMREFLIETTAKTGGHLAPGLGTIELTIALHYLLDTPDDKLVWDIGHQAYPHKLLTGRREQFHSLRQANGISGFLKRSESPYDAFGAGHSSTSISAALGMACANKLANKDSEVVAIIGDGAMTAGMAFEALNNAGDLDANLLVILNDNEMSISPNVGALSNYFSRILSGRTYTSVREGSKTVLSTLPPPVKNLARRVEEHMKGMVMPSTLFEELGFNYIGPVDGHNQTALLNVIRNLNKAKGPRFLHVITQKGKGYVPAEGNPSTFHGISPFNKDTGRIIRSGSKNSLTYTKVFSNWMHETALADQKLVAITPAMREGSGLVEFSKEFPDRYFDVGIAEQHALTFAAGLACEGMKPVVAIYSTFLQRGYDQLIHDINIQNLDVLLAVDRAGVVGADGCTHGGTFDISFLRCLPNMAILAPANEAECHNMLTAAYQHNGPAAVRYPRGGSSTNTELNSTEIEWGKGELTRKGSGTAILAWGNFANTAMEVGELLNATVVNMRFVKPLDHALITEIANSHALLVTLEDNAIMGGAGSAVNEYLAAQRLKPDVLNLGIPDSFVDQGTQAEVFTQMGLDTDGIVRQINAFK